MANAKKMSLKQNYAMLTKGLDWEPSYQKKEDIFSQLDFEGIKIHDWDKWEDPFRLTIDAYWKYQGEKEKKLYAIIDAFQQNNGQFNVTDARYVQALKIFMNGVVGLEYSAWRGFSRLGRELGAASPRIAAQMQAIDEMRHATTQTHAISHYNRYFEGLGNAPQQFDRTWYLSIPKSFFEDACSCGPFEFIVAISFAFEYVLTNLVFMPWMSGAAYNGDMSTVSFGFSAQSDEARHMTLGLEVIKFLLEQDPDNVPLVQKWIDKWFWRAYRVLSLVATMMDYMLPKRVMSWSEAWTIYYEENGGALFADLARYGIRPPRDAEVTIKEKVRLSHEMWSVFYANRNVVGFPVWLPSQEEMAWFSEKYPEIFDTYYRPRFEYWQELEDQGTPFTNACLPQLCQVCQWPCLFTEPDDPTEFAHHETEYEGEIFHFCSDGCHHIFEQEPEKYVQAWLPVNQIYQGNCILPDADPNAPDFDPAREAIRYMGIKPGIDGGLFKDHPDAKNWEKWTERPANIHQGAETDFVRHTTAAKAQQELEMSVKAITPDYRGEYRDDVKNFHGKQLLMVSWEKHTMMGWPMALAVDPAMSFGDLIDGVLPSIYGMHPEFHNIQWDKVQWSTVKGALIPDRSKSLAEHGLRHKSQVRFRTPGAESNNYGG